MTLAESLSHALPRLNQVALALADGHREDAEDLVQDTIEWALRTLPAGMPAADLRPWLVALMGGVDCRRRIWDSLRIAAEERSLGWKTR